MSTSKGNNVRQRPQKHQNRTSFRNNLHDTSQKTKFLNALQFTGVCKRCKDIIDWKIKYKKYKTLTAPKKCVGCEQKCVKHAYYVLCQKCSKERDVCSKCCNKIEDSELEINDTEQSSLNIPTMLKSLPERKRRTILRYINKQGGEQNMTSETVSHIEEMIAKIGVSDNDSNDFFDSSDDDVSEDEE